MTSTSKSLPNDAYTKELQCTIVYKVLIVGISKSRVTVGVSEKFIFIYQFISKTLFYGCYLYTTIFYRNHNDFYG